MLFDLVDLNINTDSSGEGSSSEVKVDEDTIIKYYFQRWFSYEVIILLLAKPQTWNKLQYTFKAIEGIFTWQKGFLYQGWLKQYH